MRGRDCSQGAGDAGAPVAAVCSVTLVTEPLHQDGPGAGYPVDVPALRPCGAGEAEAGNGRDDQMEVGGQGTDHIEELQDRTGPAVGEDQWQRVGAGRPDVQEVDVLAVDLGGVLRVGVELDLVRAPVELLAPVGGQRANPLQRDTELPADAGQLVGPADAVQPAVQVVQVGLRDLD